jgi:hypothetical protein
LKWHEWYNPLIHKQEFLKWANGDTIRQILRQFPNLEGLLTQHLHEIEAAAQKEAMQNAMMTAPMAGQVPGSAAAPAAPKGPQTPSSGAMGRSNSESTSTSNVPHGQGQQAQGHGPA